MIDTHIHITDTAFDGDRQTIIERSKHVGVKQMILPNVNREGFAELYKYALENKGFCYPTIGIHPTDITKDYKDDMDFIVDTLNSEKRQNIVAIGECGVDKHWSIELIEEQKQAFLTQIEIAKQYDLPLILHIREAFDVLFDVLQMVDTANMRCVFHAFSGSIEIYKRIIKTCPQAYFGIGGVVTFPKSGLQEVVAEMDLKRILLETDAPYLTPVPHRGKRNESTYLPYIIQGIATMQKTTIAHVEKITTINAKELFEI